MKKIIGMLSAGLLLLALPQTASAQAKIGPQASLGDDADFGLGGRAIVNLTDLEGWEAIGSFDLFFPDGPTDYWELNGNAVYNFQVEPTRSFFPYAGGGLNVAHTDFSDSPGAEGGDTDVGLNLLAGGKFNAPNVTPFVEVRVVVEGGQSVVVTGGILFP